MLNVTTQVSGYKHVFTFDQRSSVRSQISHVRNSIPSENEIQFDEVACSIAGSKAVSV